MYTYKTSSNTTEQNKTGEQGEFTINHVVKMQDAVIVQDITVTEQTDELCTKKKKKIHRNVCL